MRKDGPADITRETTVQIPIEWGGKSVAEAVNGLSGQTPKRQVATVEVIDPFSGEYVPVHSGHISAVGGHPDQGAARVRVSDFAHLLGEIPASVTFEDTAPVSTVLDYVKSAFLDGQEVADEWTIQVWDEDAQAVSVSEEHLEESQTEGGLIVAGSTALRFLADVAIDNTVSFGADRDTLADVLDWVAKGVGTRWYFLPQPPGEPPRLILERNPTTAAFHDVDHVKPRVDHSKQIKILENNALYQLNPPHKLRARGRTAGTLESIKRIELPSDEFFVTTAVYEPLEEQSADDYPPPEIEVDTITPEKTAAIARSELKDRLDSAAGGEMTLPPTPFLRPYARIDAVPVCAGHAPTDLPPVAYEAEEVIHYVTTGQQDTDPPSPRTVVRCGLYVDERKIETTTETMEA